VITRRLKDKGGAMSEIDRITKEGKEAIVKLLNDCLDVEYGVILNYPRILDQIINIDTTQSEEFAANVERLGKDSFRHATIVAKIIEELGGKPDFETIVIERMIDIHSMLVAQLGKEKLAMSTYKDAKRIAETSQAKAKGFFGRLSSGREESEDNISRSKLIEILTGLESDEASHIKRVETALIQMNIKPEQ